jgi:hypothetical protein
MKGAYLAVPFKVKTFLYSGALDELKTAEEAIASAGEEEEEQKEVPEGQEPPPPKPVETLKEKMDRKLMEKMGKVVDGVIIVDSMGLDTAFTSNHQDYLKSWVASIVKGLQSCELEALKGERDEIGKFANTNATLAEEIESGNEAENSAVEAAVSALGDEAKDADKRAKSAEVKLQSAIAKLAKVSPLASQLKLQRLAPNKVVLDALKWICYATGYVAKDVYDPNAKMLSWRAVSKLASDNLIDRLNSYNVNDAHPKGPKVGSLPSLKEAASKIDLALLSSFAVPVATMIQWVQAMIEFREAMIAKAEADKAEAEAKAAAEAAANAAAAEQPPVEE